MTTVTKRPSPQVLALIVISVCGFIFYALFNKQVFPAASIDTRMSKKDAAAASTALARDTLKYDVANAITSTTFYSDDDAATVLEFKLGVDKANQLMKDDVPVWQWKTRLCKELSKDQVFVYYTTHGRLASISHYFENDKKLPSLSQEEAQAMALNFVKETGKIDIDAYELFDKGSESKPNRKDHYFVWRKKAFIESEYRVRVEVAGNEVSTYRFYLAPTETWDREYKSIRQSNELLGKIASFFLFIFIAMTIGAFIHALIMHDLRWRFSLTSGVIMAVLVLLEQMNNLSDTIATQYNTSTPLSGFILTTAVNWALMSLASFIFAVLLAGGAEAVYRSTRLKQVALPYFLTTKGLGQSEFRSKAIAGYLIVGVMMFWVISYYKLGRVMGFFCPLGVDDYKVVGSFCPAISGALIGVAAAGLEEFTCRVVALGLLQKWLKNFWVANFIQAVVWGFAHSDYPQLPCYARGVELTVVGLFFGYVANFFGVIPCFVAHYLYDAFLTVEPVFSSHDPVQMGIALVILVPFLFGWWLSRKKLSQAGVAIDDEDLSNESLKSESPTKPSHVPDHVEPVKVDYVPLTKSARLRLLLVTAVGVGAMFIPAADEIGSKKQVTVGAKQAVALAKKYMQDEGIADAGYMTEVELVNKPDPSNLLDWQYVFEQLGRKKTEEIYNETEPCIEWRVRFFKPQDSKGYFIFLNGDGTKRATIIDDIDEAPGKKLDEAAALKIVQDSIDKYRPELNPNSIDTKSSTLRPNRNDYKFNLHVPKFNAGDTPAILKTAVKGDQISDLLLSWELPDAWRWPHSKLKWYQHLGQILRPLGLIVAACALLYWSVHALRSTSIAWRHSIFVCLVGCMATIAGALNEAPKQLFNYNTAEALNSFIGQQVAMELVKVLVLTLFYMLVAMVGFCCLKISFPSTMNQFRDKLLFSPQTGEAKVLRAQLWIDAALGSYALAALFLAVKKIQSMALTYLSGTVRIDMTGGLCDLFSNVVPAGDIVISLVVKVLITILILGVVSSFWSRYLAESKRSLTVILITAVISGLTSWYWTVCLIHICTFAVIGIGLWIFSTRIFRSNGLAYILVALTFYAAQDIGPIIEHAQKIAMGEIVLLVAILCAPALLAVSFGRPGPHGQAEASPNSEVTA